MDTGIKNTQEVITLAVALGLAINGAREDGDINAGDVGRLIAVVPTVAPALSDIDKIPAELRDLDSAELEVIKNQVISAVGRISSAKAERLTAHALTAGVGVMRMVQELRTDDEVAS